MKVKTKNLTPLIAMRSKGTGVPSLLEQFRGSQTLPPGRPGIAFRTCSPERRRQTLQLNPRGSSHGELFSADRFARQLLPGRGLGTLAVRDACYNYELVGGTGLASWVSAPGRRHHSRHYTPE